MPQPAQRREMVVVNCPALPETILESELFGYRRGAFTNAARDKKGLFEEAIGSTILLDEIGDLSMGLQTKLLRVLQEKEIKPLGSTRTRRVDVRIIASTNRDLAARLREGTFREDLYYRLNVATLTLPPLRERREDLPLLMEHFLSKAADEQGVAPKALSPEARENLMRRQWAGNIRELENVIRGMTALAPCAEIGPEHLPDEVAQPDICNGEMDLARPYKTSRKKCWNGSPPLMWSNCSGKPTATSAWPPRSAVSSASPCKKYSSAITLRRTVFVPSANGVSRWQRQLSLTSRVVTFPCSRQIHITTVI